MHEEFMSIRISGEDADKNGSIPVMVETETKKVWRIAGHIDKNKYKTAVNDFPDSSKHALLICNGRRVIGMITCADTYNTDIRYALHIAWEGRAFSITFADALWYDEENDVIGFAMEGYVPSGQISMEGRELYLVSDCMDSNKVFLFNMKEK